MASGNFISNTGTNLNLYITWSSTTNVSANTSTVTAKVYMRSYTISGQALTDSYITINGNKKSFAGTSLSKTSSSLTDTLLTTHTVTVAHGTDGNKSITIKANLEFNGTVSGKYLSDITASKTVTLDTIPRASTFTIPTSINTGTSLKVTINPADSSFTHRVRFEINGEAKHISDFLEAGTTSYSYTIPHSWLPTKTSQTMTVYVYTYTSNETYIAKKSTTTKVVVPASIVPSVSSITATISSGLNGKYVQGKSKVKLAASGSAGSGATISSYTFTGVNINGTSSSYTGTSSTKTSSVIQTSGKITYNVKIKDSRGRYSTVKGVSINVEKYAAPEITSISASRCLKDGTVDTNGTYAKVTVKTSYSAIDGANQRVVKLYNNIDDYATATTIISASSTSSSYTGVYGGNFSTSKSYTIKAVITDSYNTGSNISKSTTLETSARTLNIARYGNGVAVGGLSSVTNASSAGKFECNWDAYFNDAIYVTNKITCLNPYSARNFNINCYWKDEQAHDILVRSDDGLTVGLGWVGSDTYPTILDIRPTKVNVRGSTHFQCTTDAATDAQNDVPVRVGNADGAHIDIDGNEIIAKASPNELGNLNLGGSIIAMYVDEVDTLRVSSDSTSKFVKSVPTYNRTYDASPNMYITSNGVLGRATSSSQRYKIDIKDVQDDTLDPYHILNIPIRQYKYNNDNIPIGKDTDDTYIGLIAEEVAKAYPAAAEYNEDGQVEMWNIKVIVPAMLKILQDQQKEIEQLKEQLNNIN